jgi:hypothetical protein
MHVIGIILASIGAVVVLGALTYVSILAGIIIHGMIIIMAGPIIDGYFRKKGEQVYQPGSAK